MDSYSSQSIMKISEQFQYSYTHVPGGTQEHKIIFSFRNKVSYTYVCWLVQNTSFYIIGISVTSQQVDIIFVITGSL